MSLLQKDTLRQPPASSCTEPSDLILLSETHGPKLHSQCSINDGEQMLQQLNHTILNASREVCNESSQLSLDQDVITCASASQCQQLLDPASPSKLVEHMHLDIPYNWVWELDRLQLAQELARKAPHLKRLELKCFLSLQSERHVPGPFAELATMIIQLHPLLKKLIHRLSDDELHIYYTFVTSDYELSLQVSTPLNTADTHVTD